MFQAAFSWGVQPSEFWQMTIPEYFALVDLYEMQNGDSAANDGVAGTKITQDRQRELDEWAAQHMRANNGAAKD